MSRKSNDVDRAKNNEFLVFGAPDIHEEEIAEVVDSMRSGWLGTGPKVARFEEDFARYQNATFAVAVNSCTAALHLSMLAAELRPGDEVITTPLTFCATVNAIIHAGAIPVLADIDPHTMNIDPQKIEERISNRTRAIVPVHFAGRPCAMDTIVEIASRRNLLIIEDCAHAVETRYHGRPVGTFGEFGCFSFYVTKNVVTGEGGMVLCKDEDHAARIKRLALHGMTKDAWRRFGDEGYKHYHVVECGYKYNMMDLQAAIGIHQLKRVEKNWKARRRNWNHYMEKLQGLPISLPAPEEQNTRHAYHLFTILIDEKAAGITRDQFLDKMTEKGIGVGVHYLSLPEHPYYQERFGWRPEEYPIAADIGRRTVSLPLSPGLNEKLSARVINAVHQIFTRN